MTSPLQGILGIEELPIENKRVFLRVDFNVPLDGGTITDDSRIKEALPTIRHALERGARLVCASHLGRPKKGPDPKYSLEPCAARLAELLGQDVTLPEDCVGDAAKKVVFDLRAGQVCLLTARLSDYQKRTGMVGHDLEDFVRLCLCLRGVCFQEPRGMGQRCGQGSNRF